MPQEFSAHSLSPSKSIRALLLTLALVTSMSFVYPSSLSSSAGMLDGHLGTTCSQTGTTSSACSGEWTTLVTSGDNTVTFGGSSYAAAGYGVLHAASSGVASCDVQPGINCYGLAGNASSSASFSDTFNITNGPASGYLDLLVVADGTALVTCVGTFANQLCPGSSYGIVELSGGNPILFNGVREQGIGLGTGTNDISVWIPFSAAGGVAQVSNGLSLSTLIQCWVADNTSCTADVDFSDTAYVAGISVLDANGNPVNGASVTAESGTDYNDIQVSAVPEPSALILMSTGFLVLLWARNRRLVSTSFRLPAEWDRPQDERNQLALPVCRGLRK